MKKIITGFILLLCYTVNLTAQETQKPNFSTDRPGQCFSSSTVPKGHLLLETGIGVDLFNGLNSWNLTATDLRYGVAKNFELRSGVRAFAQKRAGVDDLDFTGALTAGLKWQIVGKKIELAYLAEAAIPIYPNIVNAYHLLQLSHPVGDKISFSYMLMHNVDFGVINYPGYGGAAQFSYLAAFTLMPKWSFYLELSAFWDSSDPFEYGILYDAGMTYMVKDNLQLDFFFGHGINYKHGTYGLGICWMPPKKQS